MKPGDVCVMRKMAMVGWHFEGPLYTLVIPATNMRNQLILEGSYRSGTTGAGKRPGDTFIMSSPDELVAPDKFDWSVVPEDEVPDRIWAKIAQYRLTGEVE
jgi:hypothetical protein